MVSERYFRTAWVLTFLTAVIIGMFILSGCGATHQADLWSDPSYKAAPLEKIMVIAMRRDQLKRRMWEDVVVEALADKAPNGTIAVASYQLFPDQVPDTADVVRITKSEGYDGILVVARIELDSQTTLTPGYSAMEQVTTYNRRWDSYVTRWESVYHESFSETETTVSVRTDLVLPQGDGRLVWSVTSRTVDQSTPDSFRNSVADRVADQLKKKRFIH